VAVLLAPVGPDVVARRLAGLRGAAMLRGARGEPGVDVAALAELVSRLATILAEDADLLEVDLNPVVASPGGALAVDALVVRRGIDA